MIFFNLAAMSPLLSFYPAAQRVTFLYYLGRFSFSNGGHYLRAANCLEAAYLQTPPQLVSHRTKILTYLIPCNILIGRFPSRSLLTRPEAQSLAPIFFPLCATIRSGNFVQFQSHLSIHEDWLFEKGLLIPLTYRLRSLLWRTLSRKIFLLTYVPPTDINSRKAATLDIADLHTAAVFLQHVLEGWAPPAPHHPHNVNPLLLKATTYNAPTTLVPPPSGTRFLRPNEGMISGNREVSIDDIEMGIATLVDQGLMHGFVAHGQGKFAIIGAKSKGPVSAGWPNVFQTIRERTYDEDFDPDFVPGWVRA